MAEELCTCFDDGHTTSKPFIERISKGFLTVLFAFWFPPSSSLSLSLFPPSSSSSSLSHSAGNWATAFYVFLRDFSNAFTRFYQTTLTGDSRKFSSLIFTSNFFLFWFRISEIFEKIFLSTFSSRVAIILPDFKYHCFEISKERKLMSSGCR